jgi:hypothetical protein
VPVSPSPPQFKDEGATAAKVAINAIIERMGFIGVILNE